MKRVPLILISTFVITSASNFDYLDPTKLQTKTQPSIQQDAATKIITKYSNSVTVEVNPLLFRNKKDVFSLRTSGGQLRIRASSGVAAVWGFNYYLKKYCKSQIDWQVKRVDIPNPLPEVDEVVEANDRFRYYQNVCTVSYSFVWWGLDEWAEHIEWMALNGINLALAPVAQEAAWARVYRSLGLRDDELDDYFTGPAFLSWLRMGNVHGWGGPLPKSWHVNQLAIQENILDYMFRLGIVPVLPAFNGHVPKALARLYPNSTFHDVAPWNKFSDDYCCGLFINPRDPLFKQVGRLFYRELTAGSVTSPIFTVDPFNEVKVLPWSTALVKDTANAIFSMISEIDEDAVWLLQNWMFVHNPLLWPKTRVELLLTSVPIGRMLVLDLQSEQWPQYDLYEMYFGQPFIWCMLHNFGGTLGMFGNMQTINKDVYEVRSRVNSTMIGVGLTPEGINQNYVVYDLMLESSWRKGPVDLELWAEEYAERRYGCNTTSRAWRYLLKSVYSFNGLNRVRGKYVITRKPSFGIRPWAWYKSHDLFEAWKALVFTASDCNSDGFYYDLVDVTRQALQYRAEQLYVNILNNRLSNAWVFNATMSQYLDVLEDLQQILASNEYFTASNWLSKANALASKPDETHIYQLNARNQITLWGPNGEISDYACKQWAELFYYYYIPRWRMFLMAALNAKMNNEFFDEKATQDIVRTIVEQQFATSEVPAIPQTNAVTLARSLYEKWSVVPGLADLPMSLVPRSGRRTTPSDVDEDEDEDTGRPTVIMFTYATPTT